MTKFTIAVFKLVSASLIAQVIGILLVPIITRIYTPDDFGIFELIIAIASIASVISCFSYHMAIMLSKEDSEAIDVIRLCLVLLAVVLLVVSFFIAVFPLTIANIFNSNKINVYLPYLPIFILVDGLYPIYNYWLTRKGQFGVLGISRVSRSATTKVLQIVLGTNFPSPFGLAIGYVFGYAISDLIMILKSPSIINTFTGISLPSLKKVAVRYKKFPIYSTWSSFAINLSNQVPSLMLAMFYDTTVVGLYALSYTIVNVPMNMIGSSVGQVFFQKAMNDQNSIGSVKNIAYNVYSCLIYLGIFPMLVLMVLSDDIFKLAFGNEWIDAGTYTKILIPWLFLVFISSPLSYLFSILEKQDIGMKFQVALLLSRIITLFIGGTFGGPLFALSIFSITGIIFWTWMNVYLLKSADITLEEIKRVFINSFSKSIILLIPVCIAKIMMLDSIILILIAVIFSSIYYKPILKIYLNSRNFL